MKSLVKSCNWLLETLAAIILFVLTAMVFLNVVLRKVFNSGITVTEEMGRFMFVWLVFAGAVLAAGTDSHVKVDIIIDRLPAALRRLVLAFGDVVMIVLCALIVDGGWKQAMVNMDNLSPITGLALGWLYIAGMLAGLFMGIILVVRLVGRFTGSAAPAAIEGREQA